MVTRIEVNFSCESEIQLTFKWHLWTASLIPTIYITVSSFKPVRTWWPLKCHRLT